MENKFMSISFLDGQKFVKTSETFEILDQYEEYEWFEGCALLGYYPNGDSFIFTNKMNSEKRSIRNGEEQSSKHQTIFCISRNFLEKVLKDYPGRNQEDHTCTIKYGK